MMMTNNGDKIIVDSAVHKALRHMAQAIADEHGIQITDATIQWVDITGTAGKVLEIDVRTRST
jgi:hypothetical protein